MDQKSNSEDGHWRYKGGHTAEPKKSDELVSAEGRMSDNWRAKRDDSSDGCSGYNRGMQQRICKRTICEADRVNDDFKLSEPSLPIGSSHPVRPCSFWAPDNFYLRLTENDDELNRLMSDLQKEYSATHGFRYSRPKGQMVVAKFKENGTFYRGEIVEENPFKILFVDFGLIFAYTHNIHDVYPLVKKFSHMPKQAIRCKLDNFKQKDNEWIRDEIFKKLSPSNVQCVVKSVENSNLFTVQITVNGLDIVDQLSFDELTSSSSQTADYNDGGDNYLQKQRRFKDAIKTRASDGFQLLKTINDFRGKYDRLPLRAGDHVKISHVNTSQEVYLHRVSDLDLLEKISFILSDIRTAAENKEGTIVAAQFLDDGFWYRAHLLPNNQIYFVDLGKRATKSIIRKLPSGLADIPPLVYKCSAILPPNLSPSAEVEKDPELKIASVDAVINGVYRVKLNVQGEEELIETGDMLNEWNN